MNDEKDLSEKWLLAHGWDWFLDTVRDKDTFVKDGLRIEYNDDTEVWEVTLVEEV